MMHIYFYDDEKFGCTRKKKKKEKEEGRRFTIEEAVERNCLAGRKVLCFVCRERRKICVQREKKEKKQDESKAQRRSERKREQ